jgi:Ca2+-binding EF-hand superfamily protein
MAFVTLDLDQTGFISIEQSQDVLKRFGVLQELAHSYQSSKGVAYKKLIAAIK